MESSSSYFYRATVEPQVPVRLKQDDVITMGTTELEVHISDFDDTENQV